MGFHTVKNLNTVTVYSHFTAMSVGIESRHRFSRDRRSAPWFDKLAMRRALPCPTDGPHDPEAGRASS
jgi:hypothetical protein